VTPASFSFEADSTGAMRLRGAISFANAAQAARQAPGAPRGATLDLDLAALESADSATLAVLIAWSAAARRRGATLRYRRAPQGLLNLARLTEVDRLLGFA
jgi:phospholipid transport system transporter-binding protein